jgi:SAM-dependent methyltransferase
MPPSHENPENMIASNNGDIDVDELMHRVRDEVAAMRALMVTNSGGPTVAARDNALPAIVVDLSRHAVISELIEDASRMSRPRAAIPARFERRPFDVLQPVVRFGLRVLNYAFKDQRHVNAATQQALRELQRLTVAIGNYVAQLASVARDQRNAARDLASIEARLAAAEQRGHELLERVTHSSTSEQVAQIDARLTALESALGASNANALPARVLAIEEALTLNAGRIDRLEVGPFPDRILELERAMTVNAARIASIEAKPVDERLLGLETAHTIATNRLERLEAFREESHLSSGRLDEIRRDLTSERERALRSEASLRSELTAQLSAANALFAGQRHTESGESIAAAPASRTYDDVHLAIADRFRGESGAIQTQLDRYLDVMREYRCVDGQHPIVDIGSGRGEWLAELKQREMPAFGVDRNPVLVARAQAEGLDVRLEDGTAVLRAAKAGSIGAVTAFHLIEHLSFEEMLELFDESFRALVPGGVMICETPNPANVTVGSCNFYLDPTHHHPLPSSLVSFLFETRGFVDVCLIESEPNDAMRLTDDSELARRFNDFFYGPQNYAVIARKPGARS